MANDLMSKCSKLYMLVMLGNSNVNSRYVKVLSAGYRSGVSIKSLCIKKVHEKIF